MIADNKERVIITVTKEQAAELKATAEKYGTSKSAILQIAMTRFFANERRNDKKCLA